MLCYKEPRVFTLNALTPTSTAPVPPPQPPPCQVAALSAHAQRLESDLHAATAREQQLQEEVAAAKRAATALQRSPSKISGA